MKKELFLKCKHNFSKNVNEINIFLQNITETLLSAFLDGGEMFQKMELKIPYL